MAGRLPTASDLVALISNGRSHSDPRQGPIQVGGIVVDSFGTLDNPTEPVEASSPVATATSYAPAPSLALHLADPLFPIGPPTNGNFSQGTDQLLGWRTSNPAAVSVNGQNQAVIVESATEMEVALFQDFQIPSGAKAVSFTLSGLTFDDVFQPGDIPDAFGVSLEDPSLGTSIVSTVDALTDSYYIRDLVSGVTEGLAGLGVSVTSGAPGSFRITLDVGNLAGHYARLVFRLFGGSDGSQLNGSVRISSVTVGATTNQPPRADAGADLTVNEGSLVTLQGSFTDPDVGDTHTFKWQVVSSNGQTIVDGTSLSFSFTPNDNGTYTATFTVTDSTGKFGTDTVVVTVNNVAPAATLANNGPVKEVSPTTVSFTNPADPSTADTSAGFRYSFALSTGQLAGTYAAAGAGTSAPFTFADNGSYTVFGRVFDKDGGSTDFQTTVTVTNVAPTATLAGTTATYGQATTVSFTNQFDPSQPDTSAGFHYAYAVDNPNGFAGVTYAANSVTSGSASFNLGAGTHTVYARILDKDDDYTQYQTVVIVNRATPTLKVVGGTFQYDGKPHGVTSAAVVGVTVNGTPENLGTPSLAYFFGSTQLPGAPTVPGSYTVVAAYAGSANYTAVSVSFPAAITIFPGTVAKGDTATVGFWANNNGQALIKAFGTTTGNQSLGRWLAVQFPNLYGSLANATNTQVASYYLGLFNDQNNNIKLEAQVMATALAVFTTKLSLGGNTKVGGVAVGTTYGFTVTDEGLGAKAWYVEPDAAAALGLTPLTPGVYSFQVLKILQAANGKASNGSLYAAATEKAKRSLVNDVFAGINVYGDRS